jgi:hypothetical protein
MLAKRVRLREPDRGSRQDAAPSEPVRQVALEPLRVSGVVVRKADLIRALQVYVPGLSDLQVTEDGEHFWLMVEESEAEGGSDENPAAG